MSKTVWVVQEVWSDGEEDNLSHFTSKPEAVTGFKESVEDIKEQWSDCDDFKIYHNEDVVIMQFSEHEVTVYLKEMTVKQTPPFSFLSPFFADRETADEVNLTKEEIEFFEGLEPLYLKKYGLNNASIGGYIDIEIYEVEDFGKEGGEVLHFIIYGNIEGNEREELGLDSYARNEKCLMQ